MLELIKEIDIAIPSDYEQEVIPIKYALASEISGAITSLSTGGGGGGTSVGKSTSASRGFQPSSPGLNRPGSTPGYPGAATPYGTPGGYGSGMGSSMGSTTGTGSSFSDRLSSIIKKVSSSGEIQILGQTKIIADERTNSLLIFASHEDMEMIKKIVAKLDVVLPQVLIEAVIVEVSLNNSRDLGISYVEGKPHPANGYLRGQGAINNGTILNGSSFSVVSNSLGNLPGGFSYLANLGNNDLDVTLTALQSDSRAKILQRPSIQVSHAEKASIFVGESRPYPTSSYYGGGSYGGYSSIQQLQIGVTLEVQPFVNSDGLVVMDIHQKIESVSGTVNLPNVGDVPITSQKDAVSKVSVRDRDTIILGGLRENSTTKTLSGVPYLMNVPVLGYLFRSTTDTKVLNELMVMIRPTVLPTPEVAALAARSQERTMPGVHAYRQEIDRQDAKALKESDKLDKKKKSNGEPQFAPLPP